MHVRPYLSVATLIGGFLSMHAARAAEPVFAGKRLQLTTTSTVTVSIPFGKDAETGRHLYRDAEGRWAPLAAARDQDGSLTFTLNPADLDAGRTTVILGTPAWLNLDDSVPPRVVGARVDGRALDWGPNVELGWLDAAPVTVELEIRDEGNPINPASLRVAINGNYLPKTDRSARLEIDPGDRKRGKITLDLAGMPGKTPQGTVRIAVTVDDLAADDACLRTNLAYTVTAPPEIKLGEAAATAPNGIEIFVDSIYKGYENVECLLDGKLQEPGTTTYGGTWASEDAGVDHWLCVVLPEPKPIAGVEIGWAHYQDTFWTSARYDIMTWDGTAWQRALRVQGNPETRTSRHAFPVRTTDRIMIWVPAGGNHPERPDLLWVTEVTFLE